MENDFLQQIKHQESPTARKGGFMRVLRRTGLFFSLIIAALFFTTWVSGVVFGTDGPNSDEGWYRGEHHSGFFGTLRNLILNDEGRIDGLKADRINIVFLGMGGAGHDGAYLTDTIILASIKPSTDEISMVSIPRDLAVPIPGYGWRKINHANAFGELEEPGNGAEHAIRVIEQITQQPIHYYVRMDFAGFEQLINEVGGIDVVVDRDFIDTRFPTDNHQYQTVEFEAGPQHLDGETALHYARSRHGGNGEGSDFARSRRQQKVIVGFKNKLLSLSTLLNPGKLNSLRKTLSHNIVTNADISTALQLVRIAKNLDTDNINSLVLSDAPGGLLANGSGENLYMLLPRDRTFRQIQIAIRDIFGGQINGTTTLSDRVVIVPEKEEEIIKPEGAASIEIQNGTWVVGLAAKIKARITEQDHFVHSIGNAENRPFTSTVIYDLRDGEFEDETTQLAELLDAQVIPAQEIPTTAQEDSDILIILGDDITTASL